MVKTVLSYSGKGGSGKTTVTYHLGVALASRGKRVLYVDWDGSQASLSAVSQINVGQLRYGLYEAICDSVLSGIPSPKVQPENFKKMMSQLVQCVRWLDDQHQMAILANNLRLAELESELADTPDREYVLKKFLRLLSSRFDFVLIDPPATRGILTVNGLTAADYLILPVETTSLSLQATYTMLTHPKFLPRVTGRRWEEEILRLNLNRVAWQEAAEIFGLSDGYAGATPAGFENTVTSSEKIDEFVQAAMQDLEQSTTIFSSNPALKIAAVIPNRYEPQIADAKATLGLLTRLFGPLPIRDERDGLSYVATDQNGLLMPPIQNSGTYQRILKGVAAQDRHGRHRPAWDYIADHLIRQAGNDNKVQAVVSNVKGF